MAAHVDGAFSILQTHPSSRRSIMTAKNDPSETTMMPPLITALRLIIITRRRTGPVGEHDLAGICVSLFDGLTSGMDLSKTLGRIPHLFQFIDDLN